ncbi:hypothetical protein MKX03_033134 [Papaver bracteatum]|nr:hypothetical protein MKX03_033134 [Papaver bracteatum]
MVKTKTDVIIQCLEEQNPPPPEQTIENKTWYIQINVTKNLKQTIRYPDDVEPLSIHGDPQFDNALEDDKIKKLCLCDNALSLVSDMLCSLEVPSDRVVRKKISRFVVETAKEAITSTEPMKWFFVYAELEVNTEEIITKDGDSNDVDDGDDTTSEDEDADTTSDEETTSDGEDMDTPKFTSDDNELVNMIADLWLGAHENQKDIASRSAIDELRRENYSYESGGDDHTKNKVDTSACVICMDKFEAGTPVTYMSCSHIFHEVCLVPWLQENYSYPLCRLEIQSCCSSHHVCCLSFQFLTFYS